MANAYKAVPMESESKPASRPNLRHYQRISTKFPAKIASEAAGAALDCELTNLSRAGVMALCTPEMIKTLLPNGSSGGPRQAVRVTLGFDLPVINVQKVQVEAHCDVVYLRRISRNTFHLGMSFVDFEDRGQDYIDQFIDRQLNRPG